ncbi:MAG: FAD-binding oxidoreductase [Candidatus Nanopelagicales bacterium]
MVGDRPGLSGAALAGLRDRLHGEVITVGDAGYEAARGVWNGSIDRHPAVIARCADTADIGHAIRFGREHDLLIAVRGGGHSFPGLSVCDGGLVIDLSLMKGIRVDPQSRTCRVEAGVLLGELDRATQEHGLVVPASIVTHTGVAGLTLGGGLGWVHRRYGLTIDNLLEVTLVTAEGEVVRASDTQNADLFWGVRGGGGNFGVVSEFEFRSHPLGPDVLAGPIFWPARDTADVVRFYREWIADCPDELMTIVVQRQIPDLPFVPRQLVGELAVGIVVCYVGPVEVGEQVVRPLRRFGAPLMDMCAPKPFLAHQGSFDPSFVPGRWYYVRACDVAEITDDMIEVMAHFGQEIRSPITSIAMWQMGGAVARVAEDATAFNGRGAGFTFNINGNTPTADGFDEERAWAREYWTALEPHHMGVYVNFLMEEGEDRIRAAYGAAKYDRLKALKRTYDPGNVFRLNQNIRP